MPRKRRAKKSPAQIAASKRNLVAARAARSRRAKTAQGIKPKGKESIRSQALKFSDFTKPFAPAGNPPAGRGKTRSDFKSQKDFAAHMRAYPTSTRKKQLDVFHAKLRNDPAELRRNAKAFNREASDRRREAYLEKLAGKRVK